MKEQLRGVPKKGIGYGLLRYMGGEREGEGMGHRGGKLQLSGAV